MGRPFGIRIDIDEYGWELFCFPNQLTQALQDALDYGTGAIMVAVDSDREPKVENVPYEHFYGDKTDDQ